MKKNIIFVCTGNTCRSPIAEAIFNYMINENPDIGDEFECNSAGVYAFAGDEATSNAIEILKVDYGIDISNHRATVLTGYHLEKSFLILTMTNDHKRMILDVFPEASDKVFTLKEFAKADSYSSDINDPFGSDLETYRQCADEIKAVLDKVVSML